MNIPTPYQIEPVRPEGYPSRTADLAVEITAASAGLGNRLHPRTASSLAALVRIMNCYYSNLIEGHPTRPIDIQRALQGRYDEDSERRDFQLEALAHIALQSLIDQLHEKQTLPEPATVAFIRMLHTKFYQDAPARMLELELDGSTFRMTPGRLRQDDEPQVAVGRHIPPPNEALPAFMKRFEEAYRLRQLGPADQLVSMAAAHHRFNYIHPFHDGNGRVSRLVSHAMALVAGVGAHGLWSISRGLARGIDPVDRDEYKNMMASADATRRNDLDGRGHLSQEALIRFIDWFLAVCLDQIQFMTRMFDFDHLKDRLDSYAADRGFRAETEPTLRTILERGSVGRGEISRISGLAPRTASNLIRDLVEDGIVASDTPKGALHLQFLPSAADRLFPSLFAPRGEAGDG